MHRSAATSEAIYGNKAQQISGAAQLVANKRVGKSTKTVGMSMVPSIWIVNFALIYTLNPSAAAEMPAKWAPFRVASPKRLRGSWVVPYLRYASSLRWAGPIHRADGPEACPVRWPVSTRWLGSMSDSTLVDSLQLPALALESEQPWLGPFPLMGIHCC